MTLYSSDTLVPSPEASETLTIIADALGSRRVSALRRYMASTDGQSPDEGLAVLGAYVSIKDRAVRQAILDVVLALARPSDRPSRETDQCM